MSRIWEVAGAATVLLFVASGFTPLPSWLSEALTERGPLDRADAIVVLGGGGVRGDGELTNVSLRRTRQGLRLYRQGLAPFLVLSGAPSSRGHVEAEVRARLAVECGVPVSAILTEPSGRTTREEAVAIAQVLQPRGVRRILLVADTEGMGRAAGAFRRTGFEVLPAPAGDVSAQPESPEHRLQLMRRVGIELLGRVYYRLAGYLS